jgi:hypothetical protein
MLTGDDHMLAFLIAVLGGFATPYLEPVAGQPLARLMEKHIALEPGEVRLITFMLVMLVIGVIGWLFSSGTLFWTMLGAILGYFALRIVALLRELIDARGQG